MTFSAAFVDPFLVDFAADSASRVFGLVPLHLGAGAAEDEGALVPSTTAENARVAAAIWILGEVVVSAGKGVGGCRWVWLGVREGGDTGTEI